MEVYKAKGAAGLTAEKLKAAGVGWGDCFQEIPVSVQNSALVTALMAQVTEGCLTILLTGLLLLETVAAAPRRFLFPSRTLHASLLSWPK